MESDRKLLTEIKNYESDHRPLTPLKLFWIVLHIGESRAGCHSALNTGTRPSRTDQRIITIRLFNVTKVYT